MGYVIDSNSVIDYLSGQLPEKGMSFMDNVINEKAIVSIITEIEVLGFNNSKNVEILLRNFIDDSVVIPLTDDIVKLTIDIRKKNKIKTPDAIIAATAIALNYPLITRNTNDFKNIEQLTTINAWMS